MDSGGFVQIMAARTTIRRDCERAYDAADESQKGYLTPEDYKVGVLSLLGYKPSKYEVATVWQTHATCDSPNSETKGLPKETFISLMAERLNKQDTNEVTRQVFLTFDARCQGFITEHDCVRAFQQVVPHLAKERVSLFFKEVDLNCDGKVSYRDFELIMKQFQD